MLGVSVFHKTIEPSIYLKLMEKEDAEALFTAIHANRHHLSTWLPWIESTRSVLDTEAFITDNLRKYARKENLITGIWQESSLIGCIGFNEINYATKKATIGYWLSARHQGKGIITRACRILIEFAFNELQLEKIEILCALNNLKSRAVPQRLHFIEEDILPNHMRLTKEYVDIVLYSTDRHHWLNSNQHTNCLQ